MTTAKSKTVSTAEVTQETVKTASRSTKSKTVGNPSIYIGPTIRKSGLQNGVILSAGLPKDALLHAETCPEISKLVIVADDVAEARLNISKPGTPEHKFYEKVAEYAKGVK